MQKDNLATSKFRVRLSSVIYPVSPSLAALHATRSRLLHHPGPDADVLKDTNCTKCGAYLLDGTGSVRIVRKTRRSRTEHSMKGPQPYVRVIRRSCGMCGCEEDLPLNVTKDITTVPPGFPPLSVPQRASTSQTSATSTPIASSSAVSSRQPSASPTSIHTATPPAAPSPSPAGTVTQPSSAPSKISTLSTRSPAPGATPSTLNMHASAKVRSKKKAGLHDMLARNRERQAQENKARTSGGLAAFLEGL
jgi:hypothetical protein